MEQIYIFLPTKLRHIVLLELMHFTGSFSFHSLDDFVFQALQQIAVNNFSHSLKKRFSYRPHLNPHSTQNAVTVVGIFVFIIGLIKMHEGAFKRLFCLVQGPLNVNAFWYEEKCIKRAIFFHLVHQFSASILLDIQSKSAHCIPIYGMTLYWAHVLAIVPPLEQVLLFVGVNFLYSVCYIIFGNFYIKS